MFAQFLSYSGTVVAMIVLVAMALSAILPDLWEQLPEPRKHQKTQALPGLRAASSIGTESAQTRS